jgi:hypothetical protein
MVTIRPDLVIIDFVWQKTFRLLYFEVDTNFIAGSSLYLKQTGHFH